MKIVIDMFARMTGGRMPGNTPERYHRFIESFIPAYINLASEASDANFHQKTNPPYALVPTPTPTTVVTKTDKYPVLLLANEHNNLGKVIYSTNLWEFFAEDSSETSMGIPNGTPTTNVGIDAVIYNGEILTSHPLNASLYHGAISATPGWTGIGSLSSGINKLLKTFQDRCLALDSSSGAFSRRDVVKVVKPDFSVETGITLGDTFDIMDPATFEDRYVLLFARKTTSPRLQRNTIVFVWNGVIGDSYDQKLTLRGTYKCSIERDGILYAFTQVGTTLVCHAFNGGAFTEVGRIRNIIVSENTTIPKSRIAVEGDYFVLAATSSGNTTTTSPLYWNPASGEAFFLCGDIVNTQPIAALLVAQDPTTFAYKRYFSLFDSPIGYLLSIEIEGTARAGTHKYKSNFIPAPKVKGIHDDAPMGRIQINHIEIEYAAKPTASTDALAVSLITKDEYDTETYTTQTATVKSTTAASTNAKVDDKRAIIELGANATEFEIDLTATVVVGSAWNSIIRRIIVDCDPIALQS